MFEGFDSLNEAGKNSLMAVENKKALQGGGLIFKRVILMAPALNVEKYPPDALYHETQNVYFYV